MGCVSFKEGKTTVELLQFHFLLSEKKSLNLIGKEGHY